MSSHNLSDLKAFLDGSPTSWHATKQMSERLAFKEFQSLDEGSAWELQRGKSYFVHRDGALCAFRLPLKRPKRIVLFASHTDSPALKLKPSPLMRKENMLQLGVEVYGAPLLSSWLNRDLYLAGRVVILKANGSVEEQLISLTDQVLCIPQLAIHLDREVNEKGLLLNKQEHLIPILGIDSPETSLEGLIKQQVPCEKVLAHDLMLVPKEGAAFIGLHQEMIASYRLDNLAGAYATLSALISLQEPPPDVLQMALFFDHEEVGSISREGAASSFAMDIIDRLQLSAEEKRMFKSKSLCVSIDMAHALNPNYAAKYDPQHAPLLGGGVVLKYNANQKYASSAPSAAHIAKACHDLNLPLQCYTARSDAPCGSTVGPILAQTLGIHTVDVGCAGLSMHSIREIIAQRDYLDLVRLLTHLLGA